MSKTESEVAKRLIESLGKSAEASGNIWARLGETLLASNVMVGSRYPEKKAHIKEFNSEFTSHLETHAGHLVPDEGFDRAGKKTIKLRKKDGSVKWSAWQASARMMQYLSEIGLMQFYAEEVFKQDEHGATVLHSRAHILNTLDKYKEDPKDPETPYDSCIRGIILISEKWGEVSDPIEREVVKKTLEALYIQVIEG